MKNKKMEKFWSFLESVSLFVVIPFVIAEILNGLFGWNNLIIMLVSAVLLWIIYREITISDLKKGEKK